MLVCKTYTLAVCALCAFRALCALFVLIIYISEYVWDLERVGISNPARGGNVQTYKPSRPELRGQLTVTFVHKQHGGKQFGTVCKDRLNWLSANLFCRRLGYEFGEWDGVPQQMIGPFK